MRKMITALLAAAGAAGIAVAVLAPSPASASRGGQKPAGTSTIALTVISGTDAVPNWDEQITFTVSTTATQYPYVDVTCAQNGTTVYSATTGYFPNYPWPWTQVMTLRSQSWTGGPADCTANLYYLDGKRTTTLATLAFHVYA
jgi:hypothetical protein